MGSTERIRSGNIQEQTTRGQGKVCSHPVGPFIRVKHSLNLLDLIGDRVPNNLMLEAHRIDGTHNLRRHQDGTLAGIHIVPTQHMDAQPGVVGTLPADRHGTQQVGIKQGPGNLGCITLVEVIRDRRTSREGSVKWDRRTTATHGVGSGDLIQISAAANQPWQHNRVHHCVKAVDAGPTGHPDSKGHRTDRRLAGGPGYRGMFKVRLHHHIPNHGWGCVNDERRIHRMTLVHDQVQGKVQTGHAINQPTIKEPARIGNRRQ